MIAEINIVQVKFDSLFSSENKISTSYNYFLNNFIN